MSAIRAPLRVAMVLISLLVGCGRSDVLDRWSGNGKADEGNNASRAPVTPPAVSGPAGPAWSSSVWSTLPVPVSLDPSFTRQQRESILSAMARWEAAVGRTLFYVTPGMALPSGDAGLLPGASSSASDSEGKAAGTRAWHVDNVNGIYFVPLWSTEVGEGNERAIATCFSRGFADGRRSEADILFNAQNFRHLDTLSLSDLPPADLETVAIHELGHFLGLDHTDAVEEPRSVMIPTVLTDFDSAKRRLTVKDVERIQAIYGCLGATCDAEATAIHIGGELAEVVYVRWEDSRRKTLCANRKAALTRGIASKNDRRPYRVTETTEGDVQVTYVYECED